MDIDKVTTIEEKECEKIANNLVTLDEALKMAGEGYEILNKHFNYVPICVIVESDKGSSMQGILSPHAMHQMATNLIVDLTKFASINIILMTIISEVNEKLNGSTKTGN